MAEKRLAVDQVPITGGGGGGGGAAALVKQEAVANGGGSFSTGSLVFVPIPATSISFTLDEQKVVYFHGSGTALPDGIFITSDAQIALRVDGVDYDGTAEGVNIATAVGAGALVVSKAISLPGGPHTAELLLRRPSLAGTTAAVIGTSTTFPTVLTALYTEPVFGVGAMSKEEVVT